MRSDLPMARAAAKNTDEKSVRGNGPVRGPGGRVRGGNPGNRGGRKGRSGRKPLEFKARCAELSDTLALALVEKQLESAQHVPNPLADPATRFAVEYVTNYGQTKPTAPQQIEHTGTVDVNLRDLRAKLASRLARLATADSN